MRTMPRFRLPRHALRYLLVSVLVAGCAGPVAAAQPLPRVPDGFSVELVAGSEQVRFPMFAAFDDRGRLFVAESSGLDLYKEISALRPRSRAAMSSSSRNVPWLIMICRENGSVSGSRRVRSQRSRISPGVRKSTSHDCRLCEWGARIA